jgi:hypothetical protein
MSHRGENSTPHTLQVWDGTKWVSLNNGTFEDNGTALEVSAPVVATNELGVDFKNVHIPKMVQVLVNDTGDVILGVNTLPRFPLPNSSNTNVLIGRSVLQNLPPASAVEGSVLIGAGVEGNRTNDVAEDVIIGNGAAAADSAAATKRVIVGHGAGANGGGQESVIIGHNAVPVAGGLSSSVAIGPNIAPVLGGGASLLLLGAPPSPGSSVFGSLSGGGTSIAASVGGALGQVSSLSGIHLAASSFTTTNATAPSGISITRSSFTSNLTLCTVQAVADVSCQAATSVNQSQFFGVSLANQTPTFVESTFVGYSLFGASALSLSNVTVVGQLIDHAGAGVPLSDIQMFGHSMTLPTGITAGYSSFQNVFVRQGTTKTAFGPLESGIDTLISAQTAPNAVYVGTSLAGEGDAKPALEMTSLGATNTGSAGVFVGNRNPNTASMAATAGDLYVNVSGGQLWQCTSPGTPGTWVQFSSGAGGGTAWVSLMSVALLTTQNVPWAGASGGFGNLYCSALVPDVDTAPMTLALALLSQVPGGGGGISIGIYDSFGVRLAYTNITAPIVGANAFPFAFGSGISLNAGSLYYIGVYSNQNGMRVLGATGIVGTPAGLSLGFSVPNSSTVAGALQGHPPNVSAYFGNQTAERYWAAFAG